MTGSDLGPFLRAWAGNPLRVAALAPSGAALARLITSELSASTGPVLELGPGTGSFTTQLIARGVPEDAITLVEVDPIFRAMLAKRFPKTRLLAADASTLTRRGNIGPFGAAVSGLPLLSMNPQKVMRILKGTCDLLGDGGALYQFTYGPGCPVARAMLERMNLQASHLGSVWRNLPPASVYRIGRAG